MKLNLDRPLAFIDLETTGTSVERDRIVEIAVLKVFPDGSEELYSELINPTIPIPAAATHVHGITDADVAEAPEFQHIAEELSEYLSNCDFAGFNSNRFDIPLLLAEFLRAGIDFPVQGRHMIDVMRIYHSLEKRNLQAAYRFYCGKPLEDAHSAEVDVCATYEVLKAQIHLYQSIEAVDAQGNSFAPIQNDVQTLSDFTPFNRLDPTGKVAYNDEGAIVFMFGKYKGEPLSQVFTTNPDYYEWLMSRDFSVFSKRVFEAEYKKLNL